MILVSGCLYGENCKYNGGHNLSKGVKKYCEDRQTVLVCPEVLGGLSIPRSPAEIVGGTAKDVLDGKAKVINCKGRDVTGAFIQGAYLTLDIAKKNNINLAI